MHDFLSVLLQISPAFVGVLVGYGLKRAYFKSEQAWEMLSSLCYWVLFPILLFHSILGAKFLADDITAYLAVIGIGFLITFFSVVVLCNRLHYSLAICNSTVQGACRHNSFIALAICGVLLGDRGFAIATLATAFQVVVTNLFVMGYVTTYTQRIPDLRHNWHKLFLNQLKNPLLGSIAAAFAMRAMGFEYLPVISETSGLLGRSALPLSILAMGAGLSFTVEKEKISALLLGIFGKMLLFPASVIGLSFLIPLSNDYLVVALVYATVPTAAGSYVIARITGGDAPLLSSMTMYQTLLSFFLFTVLSFWITTQGLT